MKGTNNKQILLITLLLVNIFYGCGVSIKSLSHIKWSGRNSGISEKVETMGYYKLFPKIPDAFVFYDDGTIVLCDGIPEDTTRFEGRYWPLGSSYENRPNQWEGTTGVYKIQGDTIYANLYFRNRFYFSSRFNIPFVTWMYKLRFRILDRTRILWIDEHLMDKEHPNPDVKNDTLIFHKAKQLPPPYTEMKRKRWLWQNKKDWKKYKEEKKTYINRKLNEKQ